MVRLHLLWTKSEGKKSDMDMEGRKGHISNGCGNNHHSDHVGGLGLSSTFLFFKIFDECCLTYTMI